ncbi:hypothetical protein GPJ56_004287 [Histomonas meleagridis]|uniref:uncharacterized protein n=1 Tax=Histomonas meleagridis TaxID=135588 RepID=UPI00355AB908|nr:hypothetical protein GPJ56_004287 [Histomonas meleagridis]KAH0800499.1 hypothetical protein GO595_006702 [Histomonas meleagridis]
MFGDSVDLILNRINVLGIQEILILILTKSMSFIENNSIILRISEMLTQDEETSRNAAYVLCSVYNNSSITTPIISQYNNPKVVQLMINYALSTKSIVAMTDMIILCSKIISNNPINDFLTQEQIQQLTITSDNVTQLTISAIDIIHEDIEYLFSFFFRHETLHQKLVQMLQNENTENIVNVSKIPGFVSKLIEHFRSGKWCIHMDAVVQVFELVSCYSSALQTTEWNDFISVDYNQRNAIIKNNTEEWLPLAGLCEPGISLGEEYSFIEPANDGYGYYKSKTNSGYGGYFEDDTPSIDFGDELIIDI